MSSYRKGFFGANTGLLFVSGPPSNPTIFMTFIKKKKDGSWEKPSQKSGDIKHDFFKILDIDSIDFIETVFRTGVN